MHLYYYYVEHGSKIPADIKDLKVDYTNSDRTLQAKNPFALKCSLDYDNKAIKLFIGSHACEFVSAAATFNDEQLPTSLLKVFNYKSETQMIISVKFDQTFVDLFSRSIKSIAVEVETEVQNDGEGEERMRLTSCFKVRLPLIQQSELRYMAPAANFPSSVVRGICIQDFQMNELSSPEEIAQCIQLEEFKILDLEERYRIHGYAKMLKLFLDIENSFEMDLLEKFNLNSVQPTKMTGRNNHHRIITGGEVPNIANFIELTPMDVFRNELLPPAEANKSKIRAVIKGFFPKHIEVKILKQNKKEEGVKFDETQLYHLEYTPNFFSSAVACRAINHIQKHGLENYMINFALDDDNLMEQKSPMKQQNDAIINAFRTLSLNSPKRSVRSKVLEKFDSDKFVWLNSQIDSSEPQKEAVKSIVNRTSFPSPFIVFGGPGCGKSTLAVEAIAQIVKLLPQARILVTTNSNSACDEVGDRLLRFIGPNRLYRYYSPSLIHRLNKVSSDLVPYSNLKSGEHQQPSLEEIMSCNVIISTLVNSARLSFVPSEHFDYIFIDECASVAEAYVNIPIALTINKRTNFSASIVLLGDPKQLGQITKTFHTERYGFNVSMMERVMKFDKYKYDEQNGYDANYIVQLTDNFRSHQSIIKYSNNEFYNSRLVSRQKQEIANFAIGWEHLPNKNYPVIFRASWTKSEEEGTTLFNRGDLYLTQKFVNRLLTKGINGKPVEPTDIGVISPYAAQREKLKAIFTNGIEIGTVEYFQGREKLIIILSCVRSKTKTVGFLRNEKRLNVALTRAKALLIVIGNPETLGMNKYWRKFITLCHLKKAVVGKIPSWVIKKTKRELNFEEDEDNAIRLEELMNAITLEE